MNVLIVLNYNDFEILNMFLIKIINYKVIDKIVVVDNCSTDDSFEKAVVFAELIDKVEVIKTEKNGGYGYGNNCGMRYVLEKYPNANLIISNPDVQVEENTIEELIDELDKNNLAMIAPTIIEGNFVVPPRKLLNPFKELILHIPFVYRSKKNSKKENFAFYGTGYFKNKLSYVDVALGCFFVIKGKVMKEIDFFDENIFLYYEEDVLATKLKNKGYKTAILNTVSVNHNHSITINKSYSEFEKEKIKNNSRKYFYKNYQNKNSRFYLQSIYTILYIKVFFNQYIINSIKKFEKSIQTFSELIKKTYSVLKIAVRYAWFKYHFLVPPKELCKGIIKIISKFESYFDYSDEINDYALWIENNEKKPNYKKFEYNPLISIVIPHYNTPVKFLEECLQSILTQSYSNFEICIADDCTTNKESIKVLKKYEKKYSQIKIVWRKENGGISAATNSAIDIANGDFIAFMDSDDTLSEDALYWNSEVLNNNKYLDLIYSDEDKLDFIGSRTNPQFKPDWNPDLLVVANYITHFVVARTSLVKSLGGCRSQFDGAQDHDFLLRLTEKTSNIYHIPQILYHWRMIPGSTAVSEDGKPYVSKARKGVIKEVLKRRKLNGEVITTECSKSFFNILYKNNSEKVSILLPTHDHIEYLKPCIESIYEKTTYKNFEIILIDHNSKEKESLEYFEECKKKYNNFKVIRRECDFNHSYLNNEAAKVATGEYLIFLNSDTTVITPDWIEHMLGYARQEKTGCVGVKLLYPDNTIQHAGVALKGDGIAKEVFNGIPEIKAFEEFRSFLVSNYSAVTFACAMVSKKKFDIVGGLNEKLPADYNDVDFCLEMLKLGYNNVYVPTVKLYHYESKIRGKINVSSKNYNRWLAAVEYMKNKWGDVLYEDKYVSPHYLKNI